MPLWRLARSELYLLYNQCISSLNSQSGLADIIRSSHRCRCANLPNEPIDLALGSSIECIDKVEVKLMDICAQWAQDLTAIAYELTHMVCAPDVKSCIVKTTIGRLIV